MSPLPDKSPDQQDRPTGKANRPSKGPAQRETVLRRRAAVLSIVAGVAAGVIWGFVEQPDYRGLADVQVSSQRGSTERVVSEHADALISDVVLEHWQGAPAVGSWRAAREAQRVAVRLLSEGGKLRLSFDTPDRELAETLPSSAANAYIAYVNALPLEHFRSPREIAWNERWVALNEELSRQQSRRQEIEARLAQMPFASERSEAQAVFDEALRGFEDVAERLRGLRGELRALQSQELPRGEVTADVYQQGLAEDVVYQEDLKEFAAEARQYRAELAVAIALLSDPARELLETVQDLSATTVEQRDLRPPPAVRTMLEQCLAEVGALERSLADFAEAWDQRRATVERLRAAEQVVELVSQQNQALDDATRLLADARRVLLEVRDRIDGLTANGNAGTRVIVVVNTLWRGLSRVEEQVDVLAEAADSIDPATNFRLDVHDRQLRGLRTRLRDREERIRQVLQAEADRAARAGRDEQERSLQRTINASDDQRQTLMDSLVTSLQRLRELDEQHQELRELAAELKAEDAAIVRLTGRLEQLEAERPQPQRDVVTLMDSRCEQTAGRHRFRNAGLVAVVTIAAVGLLFLLTFARVAPGRDA